MAFYDSIEKAWFEVRSKASHTFASRLYHAVPESFSFAKGILKSQLGDISLEGVLDLLLKTGAYVLVSYAASSLIGGVVGGVGAGVASRGSATRVGALAGMRAGLAVNTWVLELLGFGFMAAEAKMHQEYAFRSYESGLQKLIEPPRSCWNEDSVERAAATDFALGHAKMLQALIFGIVAYMSKGALQKERALEAMRASKVFGGEKMADWFAKNWDKLSARQRASAAVTPEMVFGKPAKFVPEPAQQTKQVKPQQEAPVSEKVPVSLQANSLEATKSSVKDKLDRYLLNPDHPVGGSKAKWFESALGFDRSNADKLANQIIFDESSAVETGVTQHGTKFNQIIAITGENGRVINVTFGWIRNNDGIVRLTTAIPTKK